MSAPRVAVVTGAGRGIGAAVVARLVADGTHVLAVDGCADDPAVGYRLATKEELTAVESAGGGRVHAVVADVRDLNALTSAVEEAERRFGRIDVAVAAAGVIAGGAPVWQTTPEEYDVLLDVNLRGVWNLACAAVPAMLRQPVPRSGRFVAVTSAAAHRGLWHLGVYGAAKHAAVGLVRGLAADLRGTGVGAVAVSPGATQTAMLDATARLYGLEDPERLADGHLLGRVLAPDEVAAAVAWAASPDAVGITGSVIHADGGFTA